MIRSSTFSRLTGRIPAARRYGIMATVLLHMLVLVVILFVRVNRLRDAEDNVIYIDLKVFEDLKLLEAQRPEIEQRRRSPSLQARNIAVNAEDKVERYDDYRNFRVSGRTAEREAQKRVAEAVKEIISENNLDPDDRELPKTESKPIDFYEAKKIEEEQVYKGPTNIYYKLDNRKVSYLPVPVYKCRGSATVRLDIRVGQRGKVELVTVNNSGTDTRDPCFLDAAREAARNTRFNFSTESALFQQGYIIYHFVAQ